ncbi:MAG: AsnC family transcriptional regulator [Ilumatobacteraceae bacterium]
MGGRSAGGDVANRAQTDEARTTESGAARRGRRGVIDGYDLTLMDLLTIDGRASTKHLAEQVGLTDATVAARLKELTDRDVLRVRAVVDWRQVGYRASMIFLLRVHGRPVGDVADELATDERVQSVGVTFGSADLVVRALLVDAEDSLRFVTDTISARQGVEVVSSLLEVGVAKHTNELHTGQPMIDALPTLPAAPMLLDDVDRQLIVALTHDARQSLRQIGRSLDVSEHTIRVRLRRLEEGGLVKICAQINPVTTGRASEFAYIGIKLTDPRRSQDVVADLVKRTEFDGLSRTVGEHDLLAFVAVDSRRDLVGLADELRARPDVAHSEIWSATSVRLSAFPWGRFVEV